MVESRWLRWIGPGVVALGAVGLIASTTFGVGVRPWAPRACAGPPMDRIAAAQGPGSTSLADLRAVPWFRQEPVLDGDGALAGQRVSVGPAGGPAFGTLDLPAESFAAGPFGRVILVGTDDARTSRLEAIDVTAGCVRTVALERSVIRRATIDPAGAFVYEMRVDRVTRADLGIWRRPIDGGAPALQVLGPLEPDGRFGRTFSTEFGWNAGGDRLAVQSCGERACRTRVMAVRDGATVTVASPDLGLLIGLDDVRLVTYAACAGVRCPIIATDLRTGRRHVVLPAGGPATIVVTPDGSRLIHEVDAATGRRLRAVSLDGGAATDLGPIPDGLGLIDTVFANGGTSRLPGGWILLGPDARAKANGTSRQTQLRHLPDGLTVPFDEVVR